jgi:hypothetical protein
LIEEHFAMGLALSWILRALLLLPLVLLVVLYLDRFPESGFKLWPYTILIAVACLAALGATFSANPTVKRWAHILGSVLLIGAFLAAFGGALLMTLAFIAAG